MLAYFLALYWCAKTLRSFPGWYGAIQFIFGPTLLLILYTDFLHPAAEVLTSKITVL
jgi:hypothetical protein